jgi:ABC-type transport system involved in cytochrome bd biosynthesis fused ATPase/permease subunit
MEAMERLMRGRTTFMIAHRLGTLANCDARLEVEDGRVVRFEQQRIAISGVGKNVAESLHKSREVRE